MSETVHALDAQAELLIVGLDLLTVADAVYLRELVDRRIRRRSRLAS